MPLNECDNITLNSWRFDPNKTSCCGTGGGERSSTGVLLHSSMQSQRRRCHPTELTNQLCATHQLICIKTTNIEYVIPITSPCNTHCVLPAKYISAMCRIALMQLIIRLGYPHTAFKATQVARNRRRGLVSTVFSIMRNVPKHNSNMTQVQMHQRRHNIKQVIIYAS